MVNIDYILMNDYTNSLFHSGALQYEHLLQLFYNITKKMEKKIKSKKNSTNVFTTSLEP
jgi:hypothetical protein